MKTIKITFENGEHIVTGFNCETLEEAEKYYLSHCFSTKSDGDHIQKCVKVELLEDKYPAISMKPAKKEEDLFSILYEIIDRFEEERGRTDRTSLLMDLDSLNHDLSIKMDWEALLEADRHNFLHDVIGIMNHIDRTSFPGKLTDCFLPRFAN